MIVTQEAQNDEDEHRTHYIGRVYVVAITESEGEWTATCDEVFSGPWKPTLNDSMIWVPVQVEESRWASIPFNQYTYKPGAGTNSTAPVYGWIDPETDEPVWIKRVLTLGASGTNLAQMTDYYKSHWGCGSGPPGDFTARQSSVDIGYELVGATLDGFVKPQGGAWERREESFDFQYPSSFSSSYAYGYQGQWCNYTPYVRDSWSVLYGTKGQQNHHVWTSSGSSTMHGLAVVIAAGSRSASYLASIALVPAYSKSHIQFYQYGTISWYGTRGGSGTSKIPLPKLVNGQYTNERDLAPTKLIAVQPGSSSSNIRNSGTTTTSFNAAVTVNEVLVSGSSVTSLLSETVDPTTNSSLDTYYQLLGGIAPAFNYETALASVRISALAKTMVYAGSLKDNRPLVQNAGLAGGYEDGGVFVGAI
jgi:hypothetical protein